MNWFDRLISWVYIHRLYGERCPDYDADCHCCKAWKEYDELFQR